MIGDSILASCVAVWWPRWPGGQLTLLIQKGCRDGVGLAILHRRGGLCVVDFRGGHGAGALCPFRRADRGAQAAARLSRPGRSARQPCPLAATACANTAAFARDDEVSRETERPRDSPRWRLAASDADLKFPHAAGTFACALGVRIDPRTTPATYRLLGKSMIDIGLSTYRAKDHYKRTRPFVVHGNSTCFPPDEAALRNDGSYPSGHSALGWGWALILVQIVPARTDPVLQRGRDFGQSRLICNAHWASDVDAGRLIAAATVARLRAEAAFRADLAAAQAELASGTAPDIAACSLEAAALADGG